MSGVEDAFSASISKLVRQELAKAAPGRADGAYSSEPGQWPPGCRNRRQARDRIRSTPGHECIGRFKATVWRVDAAAYLAHHSVRPVTRAVIPASVAASDEEQGKRWGNWVLHSANCLEWMGRYLINLDGYDTQGEILSILFHVSEKCGGMFTAADVGNFVCAVRQIKREYR